MNLTSPPSVGHAANPPAKFGPLLRLVAVVAEIAACSESRRSTDGFDRHEDGVPQAPLGTPEVWLGEEPSSGRRGVEGGSVE